MKNKITTITKKIPQATMLPDGLYNGIWSGNTIIVGYKGETYELTTEEGVRGINIPVVIEIKDNEPTFDTFNS